MPTKIEWAEETWNPITGCTAISPGCTHCYAKRMSVRLAGRFGYPEHDPFKPGVLHEDKLDGTSPNQPSRWKKPRMIFVCSMGDLFHSSVDGEHINRVWTEAFNNPQHTYMFLTKRPDDMKRWTEQKAFRFFKNGGGVIEDIWPDWMWIGTTVENNAERYRIPILTSIPAKIRFLSIEPMLGPVDFEKFIWGPSYYHDTPGGQRERRSDQMIHWVISGGETGPGARPMYDGWPQKIRDQCVANDIPFFFKRWGDYFVPGGWVAGKGREHYKNRLDDKIWLQMPERR